MNPWTPTSSLGYGKKTSKFVDRTLIFGYQDPMFTPPKTLSWR